MAHFGRNYSPEEQEEIVFKIISSKWPYGATISFITDEIIKTKRVENGRKQLWYYIQNIIKQMLDKKRIKPLNDNNYGKRYISYKQKLKNGIQK